MSSRARPASCQALFKSERTRAMRVAAESARIMRQLPRTNQRPLKASLKRASSLKSMHLQQAPAAL